MKKLFVYLIVVALICSGISLFERYQVEKNNNHVELVLDNRALDSLNEETEGFSYTQLQEKGVTGIAVYEKTISRMINESKIKLITGNEIKRREIISGVRPEFKKFEYNRDSAFLVFSDKDIINRAENYFSRWQNENGIKVKSTTYEIDTNGTESERFLLYFPEWKDDYLNLSLGFDNKLINNIREAGLRVIPRLENKKGNNKVSLSTDWELMNELSPDFIIFAGDEVSGYPDNIEKTAHVMNDNQIKLGMIEAFIGHQKGVNSLARLLNFDLIRVHSIQQGEMEKYPEKKVIDRYLRAVKERNVRVLYLKPFLGKKKEMKPLQLNNHYFNQLTVGLKNLGYSIGGAGEFTDFHNSGLLLLLISTGISAAGILLLERLINIKFGSWRIGLLLLGIGFSIGLLYLDKNMFLRKVLALGSSITFPSLAIIIGVFSDENHWFKSFCKVIGISFVGIMLLAGSLSHISFVLKIDQFRGVKLAFLLPLIIISFYYLKKYMIKKDDNYFEYLNQLLDKNIKIKHLLAALFIGLVGIVYIARSGNYSFLPTLELESSVREVLEDLLYVRPRFKAFLIGHPILVVSLYYWDEIKSHLVGFPMIILAGIGQITVANTFAHIHIPFIISLLRVFHGYWLGLIIGLILIGLIKLFKKARVRWQ